MGMFDSIWLEIKCPFCGEIQERECQTKQLKNELANWHLGEKIETRLQSLHTISDCRSQECVEMAKQISGHEVGFNGRFFDVQVFLTKGIVNGKYKIKDNFRNSNCFREISETRSSTDRFFKIQSSI